MKQDLFHVSVTLSDKIKNTMSLTENICHLFRVFRSEGYSDLGTIHTEEDLDKVLIDRFYAWIGLRRWYRHSDWSWPDGPHDWENNQFDNWADKEPHKNDYCAVVSSKSKR